jgi:hypothetical protein
LAWGKKFRATSLACRTFSSRPTTTQPALMWRRMSNIISWRAETCSCHQIFLMARPNCSSRWKISASSSLLIGSPVIRSSSMATPINDSRSSTGWPRARPANQIRAPCAGRAPPPGFRAAGHVLYGKYNHRCRRPVTARNVPARRGKYRERRLKTTGCESTAPPVARGAARRKITARLTTEDFAQDKQELLQERFNKGYGREWRRNGAAIRACAPVTEGASAKRLSSSCGRTAKAVFSSNGSLSVKRRSSNELRRRPRTGLLKTWLTPSK